MADFTRRELVDQVAYNLGMLSTGQALADDDVDTLQDTLTSLFDQLGEDRILTIGDDEAIPASWCPYLALLAANLASPKYGAAFSLDVKQANEAILRKLVRAGDTYEVQQTDYF